MHTNSSALQLIVEHAEVQCERRQTDERQKRRMCKRPCGFGERLVYMPLKVRAAKVDARLHCGMFCRSVRPVHWR